MKRIIIAEELFASFPHFKRGVIIVSDITNHAPGSPISARLDEIAAKRSRADYLTHPYVRAWEQAHLAFGSNPNKFPPSIKALLKRAAKGGVFPFINPVVAAMNYVSLKHILPCGGDDLDAIKGNLKLGPAAGQEVFIPLGGGEKENPPAGEIIYYDDASGNVMCRKWNWRNGDFSKVTAATKRMVINIDGIGPIGASVVAAARDELAELLRDCGGDLACALLDRDNPQIELKS